MLTIYSYLTPSPLCISSNSVRHKAYKYEQFLSHEA